MNNKNIMKTAAMKAMSKKVMKRAWELKNENNNYVWAECLKMAWVETKTSKTKSSKTKAIKNMTVVIDADVEVNTVITNVKIVATAHNGCLNVEEFMNYGRKVLIQVMKKLHVKKWYRIYDKATMIENIIKCVVV